MREPEWDGNKEAENKPQCDRLIALADGEELVRKPTQGDGLRVELLDPLAGPGIGALDRHQDVLLMAENRAHQD